jgi:NAD+ diphosphatase
LCGAPAGPLGDSLVIDTNELDDARWFSRDDVLAALAGRDDAPFQAPTPWAIARTLLEAWADGLK